MLKNAHTVLTFGSTVGIEAVFWGVPSILAGMSWYRALGATYNPATHDEVMALITETLAPMNDEPAWMYGYYFSTYGIPFKYVRATTFDEAEFKGKKPWRG
jgi:capsule polysaccharide export protein KpsC/LpsZ